MKKRKEQNKKRMCASLSHRVSAESAQKNYSKKETTREKKLARKEGGEDGREDRRRVHLKCEGH